MKILKWVINSVGDPWRDWGIITLYKMLSLPSFQRYFTSKPELTANLLKIQIKPDVTAETINKEMYEYLKQMLNNIVLKDFSMKVLNLERKKNSNGFFDARYTVPLAKEENSSVFEATKKRPTGNLARVELRRNYVGITPDWEKAVQELTGLVEGFTGQFFEKTGLREITYCPVCSLPYRKKNGVAMRQNKNPSYNQHHNNKVRGHANSVETMDMCPLCNFLNSLAAYSSNLPYVIGESTNLLLPEVTNLIVLEKVYNKFSKLIDMDTANLYSYQTNIPELKHRTLFPTVITLYFAIQYKYSAVIGKFEEDTDWDEIEKPYLHRWHVIRYNKGQNVIFNVFSMVDVHHRLFDLVKEFPYGKDYGRKGNLVQSFLPFWYSGDKRNIDFFAQGIVLQRWSLVAESLFQYYREGAKLTFNSISFLEEFIIKALGEVDQLLSKELLEDIKIIARSIGCIFQDDIGLFTNLNNAHNKDALRKVLSQTLFKMNRIQQTHKQELNLHVPEEARVENLLNNLNDTNFAVIKDTLIIFASLNALRSAKKKEVEN